MRGSQRDFYTVRFQFRSNQKRASVGPRKEAHPSRRPTGDVDSRLIRRTRSRPMRMQTPGLRLPWRAGTDAPPCAARRSPSLWQVGGFLKTAEILGDCIVQPSA
jgi:hypothetical protein